MEKSNSLSLDRKLIKQSDNPSNSTARFVIKYEEANIIKRKSSFNHITKKTSRNQGPPSYLRPTESSSAQLQKNRAVSNVQLPKKKMSVQLPPRCRSQQDEQNQKQYNRVPIEYYDERDKGCGADNIRARVVYRGYAPKNSYFFLKALKSSLSNNPQNYNHNILSKAPSISLKKQSQIKFDSKFQSGNLSAVCRISANQYWLYMREDTNTHGLRQWYYFQIKARRPVKIKLRIYKFTKHYSLYRQGMKPYIRKRISNMKKEGQCENGNRQELEQMFTEWRQGGQKIKYKYDQQQKCYYLEFQYCFQTDNEKAQFAMLPPYTYTMVKDHLKLMKEQYGQMLDRQEWKFQISELGASLAGLQLPFVEIVCKNRKPGQIRQAIFVMARTHPGQTVSNWALQTFIQTVLQNQDIRSVYDFFIVPMVNPDGVFVGNHRTSLIGQDLNRNFHTFDLQAFPEIDLVRQSVLRIKKTHKIRFLLDLHGHSARKNIFAYGQQHQIQSNQYLHSRILPKLLNDAISSFKYEYCVFRQVQQKKNAARLHFSQKWKINCITFQQSYGLLEQGPIGIGSWRNFGKALAQCLLEFSRLYGQKKEDGLKQYLKQQIIKEREMLDQKIEKQKKILGLIFNTDRNKEYENFTNNAQNMGKNNKKVIKQAKSNEQTALSHKKSGCRLQIIKEKSKKQEIDKKQSDSKQNIQDKVQKIEEVKNDEKAKKLKQVQQKEQKKLCLKQNNKSIESVILETRQEENRQENKQSQIEAENVQQQSQAQRYEQKNGWEVQSSELSSGDEDLELEDQQVQKIKKEIIRVGCQKQGIKRQQLSVADKKLQLYETERGRISSTISGSQQIFRLHQLKSSMPKVPKYHSKRYQSSCITNRQFKQTQKSDLINKLRKLQLPFLK